MPHYASGSWKSGPTHAPSVDTFGLPLLQRIRDDFDRQYAESETISSEDLARHWQRLAQDEHMRTGRGALRPEETQAIALKVSQALKEMDLGLHHGRVSREEWVHYMLLCQFGTPREAKQINAILKLVIQHHKFILGELQEMFEIADTLNSGCLTLDEIIAVYRREQWCLQVSESGHLSCDAESSGKGPEELANGIIKAMDLDEDGVVSYADFMAFCLGRRREEVYLHQYDISNGHMPSISPWLLGERIDGIWHCGIVVFGKEYYYGGELVYDLPGETCFGKPTKTILLGKTLWRRDELHSHIVNEMKPVYSRATYDVIQNNCNHFADKVCMWLTGQGIPKEVCKQAEELMQYPASRLLVPMLNRCLGSNFIEGKAVDVSLPEHGDGSNRGRSSSSGAGQRFTQKGMVVCVEPVSGGGSLLLGTISGPSSSSTSAPQKSAHNSRALEQTGSSWVTYFGLPSLPAEGNRVRVCTELVPHERISIVAPDDLKSDGFYNSALRAMMGAKFKASEGRRSRGSASHGLMPMSTLAPGSMHGRGDLPDSPRTNGNQSDKGPRVDMSAYYKEVASPFASSLPCGDDGLADDTTMTSI